MTGIRETNRDFPILPTTKSSHFTHAKVMQNSENLVVAGGVGRVGGWGGGDSERGSGGIGVGVGIYQIYH